MKDLETRLDDALKPARLPIALDEKTRADLIAEAKRDERSLSAEAIVLIREALAARSSKVARAYGG